MASEVVVFPDGESIGRSAAERVIAAAQEAITARGRFSFGLSGGSTPRLLFEMLAQPAFADRIDWARVFVFWGDERTVPPDHADSNYRLARETLLDHVPIPADNVFRIPGEIDPAEAAAAYEHTLRAFFGKRSVFDLLLLGLGDDGHTASLFPGTVALQEETRWVVENYVEKLATWRITMTAPAINDARQVMFLITGANKAPALRAVLEGPHQPAVYPAQLVQPENGELVWMVDEAAAAALTR
ncbi:MAG: 6-phosphogluconolactonase [Chloroflexi bacterium]|nr:6-phosphogluconolactonase [Chloroflexota bacterium]